MSKKFNKIKILVTGGGSVLGQSIFKALNFSSYAKNIKLFYTNSEPECAAYYFNSTDFYNLKIEKFFNVPIAKDNNYIPTIKQICEQEKIDLVFGGTEHEIFALSSLKEQEGFENKIVCLSSKFVDITTDKYNLGKFFDKYEISAPKTDLYSNIDFFIKKYGFPLIIKPRVSSASRNIKIIKNSQELPKELFDSENKVVIQEYIGDITEEYTVGCYLDMISKKDSYIIMKRTLTYDGASGTGKVIYNSEIIKYCKKIMQAFVKEGFEGGAFNVQLRARDNSYEAFEINGRFSSTEGPRARLGFNAVEASIDNYLYKLPYDKFNPQIDSQFLRYYEEVYW